MYITLLLALCAFSPFLLLHPIHYTLGLHIFAISFLRSSGATLLYWVGFALEVGSSWTLY